MKQLSIKPGDSIVVDGWDGEIVLNFNHIGSGVAGFTVNTPEDVSVKRGRRAKPGLKSEPVLEANVRREPEASMEDIVFLLSELDHTASQELLAQFVSDLFYSQAKRRQSEERMAKQTEGIAAARERGVQFGRARKPLPENFEEYHAAWRGGRMSLREAARACGMPHATFRSAALRMESAE